MVVYLCFLNILICCSFDFPVGNRDQPQLEKESDLLTQGPCSERTSSRMEESQRNPCDVILPAWPGWWFHIFYVQRRPGDGYLVNMHVFVVG